MNGVRPAASDARKILQGFEAPTPAEPEELREDANPPQEVDVLAHASSRGIAAVRSVLPLSKTITSVAFPRAWRRQSADAPIDSNVDQE